MNEEVWYDGYILIIGRALNQFKDRTWFIDTFTIFYILFDINLQTSYFDTFSI